MLRRLEETWSDLHRFGSLFLREVLEWLPFSDKLTEAVVSNFLIDEISDQQKKAFDEYYHNTLVELIHFWLWWHGVVLIISWPIELIFFQYDILISYAIWRGVQFFLLFVAILDFNTSGFLKKNIGLSYFLLVSSVIIVTGLSFGRTVSLESPWFNVIYALPFLCLPMHLRMVSRIFASFYFPFLYMGSFVAFYPERWKFELLMDTAFLLFYACILAGFLTHLFFNMFKNSFFVQQELEKERKRSEELLLNILPEDVADELKENNRRIARGYDEATVLFADIVDFTPLAEELNPDSVVTLLDDIVSSFDYILEDYPVEKIKTVGDEYFLVSGVPNQIEDHALVAAELAVDMMDEIQRYTRDDDRRINLRIGMHTGAVVAGVIGTDKFVFDCWGSTVNIGSRMESQGVPGRIQVTPSTRESILKHDEDVKFSFDERGEVAVKGKGMMTTYFLDYDDPR